MPVTSIMADTTTLYATTRIRPIIRSIHALLNGTMTFTDKASVNHYIVSKIVERKKFGMNRTRDRPDTLVRQILTRCRPVALHPLSRYQLRSDQETEKHSNQHRANSDNINRKMSISLHFTNMISRNKQFSGDGRRGHRRGDPNGVRCGRRAGCLCRRC